MQIDRRTDCRQDRTFARTQFLLLVRSVMKRSMRRGLNVRREDFAAELLTRRRSSRSSRDRCFWAGRSDEHQRGATISGCNGLLKYARVKV
jgi:hypothetical protein